MDPFFLLFKILLIKDINITCDPTHTQKATHKNQRQNAPPALSPESSLPLPHLNHHLLPSFLSLSFSFFLYCLLFLLILVPLIHHSLSLSHLNLIICLLSPSFSSSYFPPRPPPSLLIILATKLLNNKQKKDSIKK